MPYSTTNLNEIVKETFDTVIQDSFDNNVGFLKLLKREVPTEGITSLGRQFTINLQDNESYGSQASEGGAFPAAGALVDDRATVTYRSQFASFDWTGDVEDLATKKTLQNATARIIKNTTEAFDAKQDMFAFLSGTGEIARIDTISSNDITCLNNVTYPFGARHIRKGQRLNAYDISGAAYRSGDMVVQSVNRSTDVVAVDSAAAAIATDDDDILVFEDSYNYAPQGLLYHVGDSGTWLGFTRSSTPGVNSVVHDAASASIDWDMLETALVLSRNLRGDAAPKFDYTIVGHPVQHKNLRALARSSGNVQFNAQVGGNNKIDLMMKDVALAGMNFFEASNCPPSDVFGLKMSDWAIEEVAPRQLYKHGDGQLFVQKLASGPVYADAKEGRVYWRYNIVCKAPFRQFRIKNINFSTAETRIKRA